MKKIEKRHERNKFHISIRGLIVLTSVLVSVVFCTIIIITLQSSYKKVLIAEYEQRQRTAIEYLSGNIKQLGENIQGYARTMMSNHALSNAITQFDNNGDVYKQSLFIKEMNQILSPLAFSQKYIVTIDVIINKIKLQDSVLNSVFDYEGYPDRNVVEAIRNSRVSCWVPTRRANLVLDTSEKYVFSYVHNLYTDLFTGEKNGNIVINVSESVLYNLIMQNFSATDSVILIMDENGIVLSSNDRSVLGGNVKYTKYADWYNGESGKQNDKLVFNTEVGLEGWMVYSITDYSSIVEPANQILKKLVSFEILVIVIMVVLLLVIASMIARPIKSFASHIEAIDIDKQGNLEVLNKDTPSYIKEICVMQEQFQLLLERIDHLVKDITKREAEKQKMMFDILQEQINPHFLYNTLDTINWMALAKGDVEISQMVFQLGSFLRLSLNKGKTFYQVKDELKLINDYIGIQQLRFMNKIQFSSRCDESVLYCKVIKILLQPFVENSIKHGFDGKPGKIILDVSSEKSFINFRLEDDGLGIEKELLDKLNNITIDTGHGIKNVMKRIAIYYGQKGSVRISSQKGKGTTVYITIPKEYGEDCDV